MQSNPSKNVLPHEVTANLDKLGDFRHKDLLSQFLKGAFQLYEIRFIALFGSVARKSDTEYSDLDLFLVATDFPLELGPRLDSLYGLFIPHIDFRAHRLEEFHQMAEEWHLTILEVCYDHSFLYDPDRIGAKIYDRFYQLQQENKLIRGVNFWKIPPISSKI